MDGDHMRKFLVLCIVIVVAFSSCQSKTKNVPPSDFVLQGNIQNGGYFVRYNDNYIYSKNDDYFHLYKSDFLGKPGKKIADNHGFYELNLYSNSIYYISSYPGVARKVSPDGSKDELLINEKVGNLIVYKEHIYYRLSEDNNWGKMYRADLNGQNKKLLSQRVNKFCIYNDKIYYSDIGDLNALCSMNIDGSGISVINKSLTNNILVENNMLIYSDHDRNDNLFTYDLSTNIEKCISKDKCWNLNCNKDFIFYRNQSDSGSLYCLRFDGTEKRKLVEDSVTDILVIDDYLIYRNVTKYDKTEYLDYNSYLSK